jgi:hypothetical protein
MNILIIGPTEGGKTTVGHMLADMIGGKGVNSGDVIREDWERENQIMAHASSPDIAVWYPQTKDEIRSALFAHGIKMETPDASAVMRACLARGNIVTGMRRMAEYWASSHLFDLILWVAKSPAQELGETDELDPMLADLCLYALPADAVGLRAKVERLVRPWPVCRHPVYALNYEGIPLKWVRSGDLEPPEEDKA